MIALALAVLLGEVSWYSDPVQDWYASRRSLPEVQALAAQQPGSVRFRYFAALAFLRAGRSAEALEQARAGTVMDPRSARLFRVAGLAAYREGQAEVTWNF